MIRSMQDGFLWGSKFVGSEMSWNRPIEVKSSSSSVPSGVVSPSGPPKL